MLYNTLTQADCLIRAGFLTRFLGSAGVVICPTLLSAALQSRCSPLTSVGDVALTLQLGLSDGNPTWLTPAVTPHPGVELIQSAPIPSSSSAVSHCSLPVTEAVG